MCHRKRHSGSDVGVTEIFTQPRLGRAKRTTFAVLPAELRLRIWEASWPAARLVEVRLPSSTAAARSSPPRRIRPSRQVGGEKITVWNSQQRRLESIACHAYAHPVALQVCRESRRHTLQTYVRLAHAHVPDCCVYFDPRRDVLWLHRDLSQFDTASLARVQRVLFKDVERAEDSDERKKLRRRELLEMIESMGGAVREVLILAHWTSIADLEGMDAGETGLYDWMQYFVSILDENWESLDGHPWLVQFLSTWGELGVCFDGGEARIWGDAREGPRYSCPSHDVVYRKRLVERFPKKFVEVSRVGP